MSTAYSLWVGLGNPIPQYIGQRHNIGQHLISSFAYRQGNPSFKESFSSLTCTIAVQSLQSMKLILLLPQTQMNLSGYAVLQVVHFFKIPLGRVIVFHDDIDLPFGKVRLKRGGEAGGHNGLLSLDGALSSSSYARVRLGIGRGRGEIASYVLSPFSPKEKGHLIAWTSALLECLPSLLFLSGDRRDMDIFSYFMSTISLRCPPPSCSVG